MTQKKQNLKKHYEEYINEINAENQALKNQFLQLQQRHHEQKLLEQQYYSIKEQYTSTVNISNQQHDTRNLQKQLNDLHAEKQRLLDMLRLGNERLNEVQKYQKE